MNETYQKLFSGKKSAGFTLIELLVVVLIIGILSAVALPQYKKAVDKARFQEILLIARDLYQANIRNELATGNKNPVLWDELDIGAPGGFENVSGQWRKKTGASVITVFKPSDDIIYVYWYPSGLDMNLGIRLTEPYRGVRCAYHNNAYVKGLCESFGANADNNYTLFK